MNAGKYITSCYTAVIATFASHTLLCGMERSPEFIIFIVFSCALAVQLGYIFILFFRVYFHKPSDDRVFNGPVSVVICAKNEAENLRNNLPYIFHQDYPNFQVVVVNDGSWDSTADVLREFEKHFDNLHVVFLPESDQLSRGKKIALTLGIKGAIYPHLVFTDADCQPNSDQWLRNLAQGFTNKKQIVLGYSPYRRYKGVLNALIRFDTLQIGIQYLSFALAGIPYMGVGRNLAYTREVYDQAGGFRSHYHIPSGDDDIFVNQAADATNTQIVIDEQAQVRSEPKQDWKAYWRQKKRHFGSAKQYRFVHKLLLILYPFSLLLFYTAGILLLFYPQYVVYAIVGLLVRPICQMTIFRLLMSKLGDKDLVFYLPILEILNLAVSPIIYFSHLISKQKRWS